MAAVSGFARKVAIVAGVVALAATGVGFAVGAAGYAGAAGIAGIGSFTSIASAASVIGGVASLASGALAKTPPARGSVNGITIGGDQPMPWLIGETYYGGARVQQIGYGPTIDKVPNPYGLMVDVYSGAGPVQGLVDAQADFVSLAVPAGGGAAGGYASGFLWAAVQRGATPEPSALTPRWAGAPGWGADYRLSGYAAIAWSLLFDKKGKVFASGVPQLGAVWRGQLAWDPRQDSTLPGGQGAHRWAPPASTAAHDAARATWTYNECPGLQALRYVLGAWHRDTRVAGSTYQKVAGIGVPLEGVIFEDFVHLANVCDANGWKVGGVIFDPATGSASLRWQNLKDILAAGGAEPCFRGGRLGLRVSAPRIALDTITGADLTDDGITICTGVGWEERLNTLIPKYRSRDHKWEYVASTTPVSIAAQVAVDGEIKRAERQYNLVQDKDQAAKLCAYELFDRRELGEIEITVKPRLRKYGPGDLLIVDLPDDGLIQQPCIILKRLPMPERMAWKFTLRSETPGKHAFALGQTATAPPIPALRSTADLDSVAAPVEIARGAHVLIRQSLPYPVTSDADSVLVAAFDGVIDDGSQISFPAADLSGKTAGVAYVLYWRLSASAYVVVLDPGLAEAADSDLVFLGNITTANADGTYPETPTPPGGWGGNGSGGNCLDEASEYLLANGDRSGPGAAIAGADLAPGAWLWTQHADTREWMAAQVTHVSRHLEPIFAVDGCPRATKRHRFADGAGWLRAGDIGSPDGTAWVLRVTVAEAQSYMARAAGGDWVLSHNLKPVGPDQ